MKQKLMFYGTLVAVAIVGIGIVVRIPGVGPFAKSWING